MRIPFTTGNRSPKVVAAIIKKAPGAPLYLDDTHEQQIGTVRSIQVSEGDYFVADCAFDASAALPADLKPSARSAPTGLLVGACTRGKGPDEQPLHCCFLTRG